MASKLVRATIDAHVFEGTVNQNLGQARWLRLNAAGSNQRQAHIFFSRPFPRGATILTGTLKIRLRSGWGGGPHTITAKRITQAWKEGTITWNNKPTVTATNQATVAVTGGVSGQLVELDIKNMLQDVAGGSGWYGIRLEVNTTGLKDIYAAEATVQNTEPQMFVEWGIKPQKPVDLNPGDGTITGDSQPTVQWTFRDAEGQADQAKAQVQVDDDETFASPLFDSGWVTVTDAQLDLGAAGMSALPASTTRYWRVRVEDAHGLQSPWSDVMDFQYVAKGTLSITFPTAGGNVEETTPPVVWSLSGATQSAYQVFLDEIGVPDVELHNSGRKAGAATSYNWPHVDATGKVHLDQEGVSNAYRVRVRVWDTLNRTSTAGDKSYYETSHLFGLVSSAVPSPVTSFTATAEEAVVRLNFNRATAPDWFMVKVDGKIVSDRIDPGDVFVSGTSYRIYYYGAKPRVQHTYEVVAVVLDGGKLKHSQTNPTANLTTTPRGIWIFEPLGGRRICIVGETSRDAAIGEDAEMHYPIGRRDPVRITTSVRGYEGTVSGQLEDWPNNGDAKLYRDRLEDLKGEAGAEIVRICYGDYNFPVLLGNIAIAPNRVGDRYIVSVEFFQIGEYTFRRAG